MIVGKNQYTADIHNNWHSVNWIAQGTPSTVWVASAFKADGNGNGSGDWARLVDINTYDAALYVELQNRYIEVNKNVMPWLAALNTKGDGIDLATIPMSTSEQFQRPTGYPDYLPSLFISAGEPYQSPKGTVQFRPQIAWNTGDNIFIASSEDIAYAMLYLQPVVAALSKEPYAVNWQVTEQMCGAVVIGMALSFGFTKTLPMDAWGSGFAPTMMSYIIRENLLNIPPQPHVSGLENIISKAVVTIVGKIPVIGQAWTAVKAVANAMNPKNIIPNTTSASVAEAAQRITDEKVQAAQTVSTKNNILIVIIVLILMIIAGYYIVKNRK